MKKAVSPIIATVILISITVVIAAMVGPWAYQLAERSTNQTGTQIEQEITCKKTAYDFVSDFGINGVEYSFTGTQNTDFLRIMLRNQGQLNLYGFSIEAFIDSPSGLIIKNLGITERSQKTREDPLKPGQSALLTAIMDEDLEGTLQKVTVLNGYNCPPISQEDV